MENEEKNEVNAAAVTLGAVIFGVIIAITLVILIL